MAKKTEPMPKNLQFTRIFADREAVATLNKIADLEGRSQQRQLGLMLERIAKLYREQPEKLVQVGLISPFIVEGARVA